MANLHKTFGGYNQVIRLSDEKREELIASRNELRGRIYQRHEQFQHVEDKPYEELEFQSQGSFETDTIIAPENDDYDLDDGVYFIGPLPPGKRPAPAVFHKTVLDAIGDYDASKEVIDKETCVRVIDKKGFHIDLPIYYAGNKECPDLAVKSKGWILSNPVEFIAWFEEKAQSGFQKSFIYEARLFSQYERWLSDVRKNDVQIRRIVRYLKSWGDLRREEMPCGLIMTILVANNYYPHDRDDIALKETLVLIESSLRKKFQCLRPTSPVGEDLLATYEHKDAFMRYLQQFIENAKKALAEPDPQTACEHWQKSLGKRFKCQEIVRHSAPYIKPSSGLVAGVGSNKPYGNIYE
ncbi:cyclic GMP-AMP synthase DncV-like nucleotidyltransferase [Chitinophaga sp. S165]|uniref:cyclic GMP-AMP synthase DncV-like nucleotidyltransferase n=1 Tax=Chitinophaga sp. S165 TaxID=2135462 RepID=UPI000D70C4F6|nr:hypothetical protein [Chitinophaga sp. S165]PWV55521.1 hypothetical protein C7475_10127 [Chitinophaga sp. S165]